MNNAQLNAALKLAQSDADLSAHDESVFDGSQLAGFKPVFVTIPQVAKLLRSNVINFSGGIDSEELQRVADSGRHKFTVIGEGA